ncbi:hypothetical protein Tco_1021481 [Tanacetum coccineum]
MLSFNESDTYVLERFDTSAGNPVKKILLKLNLPDHRSILMDSKVTPTNHGRMTKPYSSPSFNANYFNAGYLKIDVKRQSVKVKEIQERSSIKAYQIKKEAQRSHSCQDMRTSSNPKSMITTTNHKLMIEVKDYELKTEVKA